MSIQVVVRLVAEEGEMLADRSKGKIAPGKDNVQSLEDVHGELFCPEH